MSSTFISYVPLYVDADAKKIVFNTVDEFLADDLFVGLGDLSFDSEGNIFSDGRFIGTARGSVSLASRMRKI